MLSIIIIIEFKDSSDIECAHLRHENVLFLFFIDLDQNDIERKKN